MSRFRRIELLEPDYGSVFVREASIFTPKALTCPSFLVEEELDDFEFGLDLRCPIPKAFELFDTVTDLIRVDKTPSFCTYKRIQQRSRTDLFLQSLCDRVSALESRFDQLVSNSRIVHEGGDRKYKWTAEIEGPVDRKYKWTAEIKEEGKEKKKEERKYKWTAQIEGKGDDGPISRKYTIEASSGGAGECSGSEKKEKKKKKTNEKEKNVESSTRVVQIEEPGDHRAVVLRHAFARRSGGPKNSKGKQKELSPQDAALLIQMTFRAYLIRRSQALRALREIAIAKAKLKEIRALFNNFSYRRHVARDAEERQRFSEKIIVLLLTVDAIEGSDLMLRAAKRSMVDELEAMLDVVDPQPPGKLLSMRRTFDMPDGVIRKEIAEGVAQVVRVLDNEENGTTNTF